MNKDDLISRAEACECIGKMIHEYREKGEHALADGMILACRYGIKCLPAVDAMPVVHGRWIYESEGMGDYSHCSECGCRVQGGRISDLSARYKLCPNCGAIMDKKEKEKQV